MSNATDPLPVLRTDELVLEPIVAAHADGLFPLLVDPLLYRYLDQPPPPSAEDLRRGYRQLESRLSPDGREAWLNWALLHPQRGLLGFVQATVIDDAQSWIAYVLGRAHWGHGFATRAVREMVAWLARERQVRRLLACVHQDNRASCAVVARLGFVPADAQEARRQGIEPPDRLYVATAGTVVAPAGDIRQRAH